MAIDLNADLGEGFGTWRLTDDEGLLEVVTSANVACGFHAGDALTMATVCRRARERKVSVGAQVGYRDLIGFGRRDIDVNPVELSAEIRYQVGALSAFADVRYLKPHGALYNRAADDPVHAGAIVDALLALPTQLPVLGLPGSALLAAAEAAGLTTVREGFPDRAYDGQRLRPRSEPGAVIHDPDEVASRAVAMAQAGEVDSLCLHGDTPGAVAIAQRVRSALEAAGIDVVAFA